MDAHNSFALRPMGRDTALDLVRRGRLVAVIEIPKGLDAAIADGRVATDQLTVDNVNLDMAEDVRRAVPAAAAYFGVGVLEHGYNSLVVTPEPVWLLLAVLALIALVPALLMGRLAHR